MKRRNLWGLVLAVAVSSVAMAGCSAPKSTGETSAETEQQATETKEEAKVASYKKDVVIGADGAIVQINPLTQSNWMHNWAFKLIYNQLVSLDSKTFEIAPELATSWNWISDTELEMQLRDDVLFHNGEAMTADDVVWSLLRMKEDDATVTNINLKGVTAVEKTGDYSIKITLAEPNVDFLMTLAQPSFAIFNQKALEEDPELGFEIGTGAFKLAEMTPNIETKVTRNDDFWGEKPVSENITIKYIAEDAARLIALQTGEIDVCVRPSTLEIGYIEDDADLDLVQFNSSSEVYFAFNTTKAPGNNRDFRLAVAHALNLDDIVEVGANGYATTTATHWGLNTFGRNNDIQPYEYNQELAKEYLGKAFPNGGAELTINTTGNERVTVAQMIQGQLEEIGIKVNVEEVESAAMTAMSKFDVAEHEAMVYNFGWLPQGDDVRRPFYPKNNTNKAIVTNDRIIELIDAAVKESDEEARKEMYAEIQEINHEEAYYLPIYFADQFAGVKAGTTGVIWEPNRAYDFTYIAVPE